MNQQHTSEVRDLLNTVNDRHSKASALLAAVTTAGKNDDGFHSLSYELQSAYMATVEDMLDQLYDAATLIYSKTNSGGAA